VCKWMTCNSCRAVVQLNSTGICLGCQGGFAGQQQEDKYIPEEEKIQKLKAREKELEDAIQKSSSEKVYVQSKTKIGKRVRSRNSKRKEITEESKK